MNVTIATCGSVWDINAVRTCTSTPFMYLSSCVLPAQVLFLSSNDIKATNNQPCKLRGSFELQDQN